MRFILITAAPDMARSAEAAGVDQIMVDMEVLGKHERQGHLPTHKAAHTLDDVAAVAAVLSSAEPMVRVNPLGAHSGAEVGGALARGAKRLMLPMFRSGAEVGAFAAVVAGRAPVTWLVETAAALADLDAILALLGADDRIHFGLNDLSIDLGLRFVFEPLADGLLDGPAALCRRAGVSFGIGGVARAGQGAVPAEMVLGEHVRLGSEQAILSRAFHGGAPDGLDLKAELALLHAALERHRAATAEALEANRAAFVARVRQVAGAGAAL